MRIIRNMTPRIYPAIGHIKLRELRPDHLNAFYSQLAQSGSNRRTGGTLSNCTIRRYHRFISIVLSQAVKEGLIPMNVAARAEPPKVEKHEPNYLQPTTIPLMLDALEREPLKWRMLVHLMLVTGARRGEILSLKWENVDFDNSRIYICRSISYTPDRGVYESTPKTASSKRYSMALILSAQLNGSDTLRCQLPAIYTRMLSSRPTGKTRIYSAIFC